MEAPDEPGAGTDAAPWFKDGEYTRGGYYRDEFSPHWAGPSKCGANKQHDGVLPSLIILGVHKGGSTLLFSLLSDHGEVRPAYCKEVHFFDVHYKGVARKNMNAPNMTATLVAAYRKYFRGAQAGQPKFASVEATPSYFPMPLQAAERMRLVVPDVKLAVVLRNPVSGNPLHAARTEQRLAPCSVVGAVRECGGRGRGGRGWRKGTGGLGARVHTCVCVRVCV